MNRSLLTSDVVCVDVESEQCRILEEGQWNEGEVYKPVFERPTGQVAGER